MASRSSDQKGVVDSIIDEQLDAAALAEEAYQSGLTSSDRIIAMAKRVHGLVVSKKLSPKRGKELLREGMVAIELLEYFQYAGKIQDLADKHTATQQSAIKAYGKPLQTVGMVRNVEIKARENEKAGAVTEGRIDNGSK